MTKRISLWLFILAFVISVTPAYAGMGSLDIKASAWKSSKGSKGEVAKEKLLFGLKNTFLGWTEILTETYDGFKKEGKEAPWAFIKGIANAVLDTAGGILHVVTFPLSIDVPLPEGGTDSFTK